MKVKIKKLEGEIDNYKEDLTKNFIEHSYFFKYENIIRNQMFVGMRKLPVKYFDTEEKAKNYIDNEAEYNKDYYYQEIEVE